MQHNNGDGGLTSMVAREHELTVDEAREALRAMPPKDLLPVLVAIRKLTSERPERGEGLSPYRRSRAALRA